MDIRLSIHGLGDAHAVIAHVQQHLPQMLHGVADRIARIDAHILNEDDSMFGARARCRMKLVLHDGNGAASERVAASWQQALEQAGTELSEVLRWVRDRSCRMAADCTRISLIHHEPTMRAS